MNDITEELAEIGRIIDSANLLTTVRKEVRRAMSGRRAMVVGGEFADHSDYDVVVVHQSGEKGNGLIQRRLRGIADLEIEKIDSLTQNVLGIRHARRGRFAQDEEA